MTAEITNPQLPDATAATVALLKLDEDLRALVQDDIYAGELPKELFDSVGQKYKGAVLIRDMPAGSGIGGTSALSEPTYNVYCLGETPENAKQVYLRVYQILRTAVRRVVGECLLHSYDQVSAPRSERDAKTQWPYSLSVWKSLASTHQAT